MEIVFENSTLVIYPLMAIAYLVGGLAFAGRQVFLIATAPNATTGEKIVYSFMALLITPFWPFIAIVEVVLRIP